MWYILFIKEWYFFMRFTHAINVVIPFGNSDNIINETNVREVDHRGISFHVML